MKSDVVVIKLTQMEARAIWHLLDGVADAGSCEGGLDPHEFEAIEHVSNQILNQKGW